MELLNEFFVLFTNYHLLLFTDFLADVDRRANVGTILVFTICACIFINISVVVWSNGTIICQKLKLWWIRKNSESIKLQRIELRKTNLLNKQGELNKKQEEMVREQRLTNLS